MLLPYRLMFARGNAIVGRDQGGRVSGSSRLLDSHHGAESSRAAARHRDPHRRGQTARRDAGSGRGCGTVARCRSAVADGAPGGCCRGRVLRAGSGCGTFTGCDCGREPQIGTRGRTVQRSAVEALRPRDRNPRASDHGAAVCVFRAGFRGQVLATVQRRRMARSPSGAVPGVCGAVLLVRGQLLLAREPEAAAGLTAELLSKD